MDERREKGGGEGWVAIAFSVLGEAFGVSGCTAGLERRHLLNWGVVHWSFWGLGVISMSWEQAQV